jgi:hypothetical protein
LDRNWAGGPKKSPNRVRIGASQIWGFQGEAPLEELHVEQLSVKIARQATAATRRLGRSLRDIARDSSRLIFGKQFCRRSSPRLILEIDIRQLLAAENPISRGQRGQGTELIFSGPN